nr:MAG TPA: hypothetical protein [Caudoviricetes sp.]
MSLNIYLIPVINFIDDDYVVISEEIIEVTNSNLSEWVIYPHESIPTLRKDTLY